MRFTFNQLEFTKQDTSYQAIERADIGAIVFWKLELGKYVAKGFKGRSNKSVFYIGFNTKERMDIYINEFFKSIESRNEKKQAEREAAKAITTNAKVGDIFFNTWGYDQTNVNFYQVTEVSPSKKSIKVKEIGQNRIETGFMQGDAYPSKDKFLTHSQEVTKKIGLYGFEGMAPWDGTIIRWSAYA